MVGRFYRTPHRHVALRHVFTHISHGCKKPLHPASPRSPSCDNLMNFLLLWKKIRSSLAGTLPYYLAGVSFFSPLSVFFFYYYSFPFFSARFSWVCLFPNTKSAAESLLLFSLPAIWFLPRRIFRAGDKQQGLAGKHSRAKPNTSEVNQKKKKGVIDYIDSKRGLWLSWSDQKPTCPLWPQLVSALTFLLIFFSGLFFWWPPINSLSLSFYLCRKTFPSQHATLSGFAAVYISVSTSVSLCRLHNCNLFLAWICRFAAGRQTLVSSPLTN